MSNTALQIESVSKLYKLGVISTGTLSHDLNRWWHRVRGLEDPYQRVAESNVRDQFSKSGYVWALKDVSFDVQHGEAIGIIGKNGAGKSTLLKILSRVTSLTKGEIKINGRIASLLEVGTGFHGELTGRENIFLNGTILGMKKHEIRSRLDEIIDFSGVERFIDTPVKRYSSGMYVRLAFAVAAHLEPEILIVDEVLAVGDAEFQKKAIGKMQDVSRGQGRTVLFVSHNMGSIKSFCKTAVLLSNGMVAKIGNVNEVVEFYIKESCEISNPNQISNGVFKFGKPGYEIRQHEFLCIKTYCDHRLSSEMYPGCNFRIEVNAINAVDFENFTFGFIIKSSSGEAIIGINNYHLGTDLKLEKSKQVTVKAEIDDFPIFTEDQYSVDLYWGNNYGNDIIFFDAFTFTVKITDTYNSGFFLDKNLNKVFLKNIQFSVH